MKNLLFVLGTRPEVIKLAPVILEFKKSSEYNVIICNTEQQKELSNQTLDYFSLKADISLDCMRKNQTLGGVQSLILESLEKVFKENSVDATFVQGDTMSVFCGALVSFYNRVPVIHVEAGLRSYDLKEPFPEEGIRQMVSRISSLHFCPTETNKASLLKENIEEKNIFVVGNTVIDALNCLSKKVVDDSADFFRCRNIVINDRIVLITVHRRENHGGRLDSILKAISDLSCEFSDHTFVIPVHPNPNVNEKIYLNLNDKKNIMLLPPLEYPQLVFLMKRAKLILTDSGGIQEEAPTFKCPTLVLRYETERQESVKLGISKLVGADVEKIMSESRAILSKDKSSTRVEVQNPYGDSFAASRIKSIVDKLLFKSF